MSLVDIPEFDWSIDQLQKQMEIVAEKKMHLTEQLIQAEAELQLLASITSVKVMKELGKI